MLVVHGVDAPNEAHVGSSVAPGEQAEAGVDKLESNSTPSTAGEQQQPTPGSEQYVALLLTCLMSDLFTT